MNKFSKHNKIEQKTSNDNSSENKYRNIKVIFQQRMDKTTLILKTWFHVITIKKLTLHQNKITSIKTRLKRNLKRSKQNSENLKKKNGKKSDKKSLTNG